MPVTVTTLEALKKATERLDKLEAYVAKADFDGADLTLYWRIPYGGFPDAERDLAEKVRDLVHPHLPAMIAQAVANARHDVEVLTGKLHVELGKDGMCTAVEPERYWPLPPVPPVPHAPAREAGEKRDAT